MPIPKPRIPVLNLKHPLARGLVCAMPFHERGSTTLHDLTKRRTGTAVNQTLSTLWTTNKFGTEFTQPDTADGATVPHIDLPDNADMSPEGNNFTVSFLCRPASLSSVNRALYLNYDLALASLVFLHISTSNVFAFNIRDTGSDDAVATSALALVANNYYLVHGVRRGTTAELYINGVLSASDTDAALGTISLTGGRTPFVAAFNNGAGDERYCWHGGISDFRWWSRALLPVEIAAHWTDLWGLYRG